MSKWTVRVAIVKTVVISIALASLTLLPASVAHAGTTEAMNRCRASNVPEAQSEEVTVRGDRGGSLPAGANPGNILERGDVFRIVPNFADQVTVGGGVWGPNGNGVAAPVGWPFPGMIRYSPILRFNNNPSGWIGAPRQATEFNACNVWTDSASARFLFYVNDDNITDNQGSWRFNIQIYKASAPMTSALGRCRTRASADIVLDQIPVNGNGGGSAPLGANPRNILRAGDVVRLLPTYTDRVGVGNGEGPYGPNGNSTPAPAGWPFPGMIKYSPILRFNNNPAGWIGSPHQATEFSGCLMWRDDPVRLLFYVNDDNIGDNVGAWRFRVLIYHNQLDRYILP